MYQYAAAKQTRTAQLPSYFQKHQDTVRDVRVNETKLTSRNAFTLDHFALGGKK